MSRALFMQTQQVLWETPEVTTAAKAACQPASNCLNHRFATVVTSSGSEGGVSASIELPEPPLRHCRNLQQLPQGPGCLEVRVFHAKRLKAGAVHANAADPVGDAGGHDGSDGGVTVSI
ncbi:hypothetical protein BWR59_28385 [Pseudomonas sp. Bc-h]|nr:hypothetical protein BWR59_28385 [Pseudomonas sp. Bc-h]